MEKYTCKLCSINFFNGRALGGHMRSHVAAETPFKRAKIRLRRRSYVAVPSSSSMLFLEEEKGKTVYYDLRANPKKSIRLGDHQLVLTTDPVSVVLDRESEMELSKRLFRRPLPKRDRKSVTPEPVSSISDTTPQKDVALSLMMLSRDIWVRSDESDYSKTSGRSRYRCCTCKKVFHSYQALGGHRASHKKLRCSAAAAAILAPSVASTSKVKDTEPASHPKIHECPVCFKIFWSGQALGGHKRSHLSASATAISSSTKFADYFIDLNLPAPIEDEGTSQIELSALSYA